MLHAAKCVMDFQAKTITFPLADGGMVVLPYECEALQGNESVEVEALSANVHLSSRPTVCLTQRARNPGDSSRFDQLKVAAEMDLACFYQSRQASGVVGRKECFGHQQSHECGVGWSRCQS